jgi:prepilin-type N-terminal cleavage/methylation domain-containing protein
MISRSQKKLVRAGMTLLELILALAIASIVMMAIAMAMQLQANTLDSRRHTVEEVQLARAILRQISDDLRSAARYEELTISDTSQALNTDSGSGASGGSTGDSGGSSSTSSTADQASGAIDELDVENSTATTEIPGVFGNQQQIQIDVSRLPRIDEYQPVLAAAPGQMMNVPSGYRTVAYFYGVHSDPLTGEQTNGLIRRELDRTITDFATKNGNLASIDSQGELLAAEVTGIEFRYYDGQQYVLQWDTASTTALPLAVEIRLSLRPPVSGRAAAAKDDTSTVYRMVVAIPTGELPPDASLQSTTDSSSNSNSTSNSSSSSNSSAASGGTSSGAGGS